MKLRHAAAFALMGWYLMVPPFNGSTWKVDTRAPIQSWRKARAFDTVKDCESYRGQVIETFARLHDDVRDKTSEALASISFFSVCASTHGQIVG
jgi:hypothetical protein